MTSAVRKFDTEISDILARAKANGIRKPFVVEFLAAGSADHWTSFAPSEVPAPKTYEEAEAFALANMGTGRARISIRTYKSHAVTVAEFFPA
jgi:hypothetical protein